MVDTAATRALRTMDLVPYILEHPGISTSELANKFSVTKSQIENDLKLVFMCGLPGYTPYELIDLVFEDGVVSIIDPQVLNRPRNFSSAELIVIKLGLEILKGMNQYNNENLEKISKLSSKIKPVDNNNGILLNDQSSASPYFEQISKAIIEKRLLDLKYQGLSKDETSRRLVYPYRINLLNGNFYLIAFDLNLKAERVFRLDLIRECKVGDLAKIDDQSAETDVTTVVLLVDAANRNFLERNSSIIVNQTIKVDKTEATLNVKNLDWIKRSILSNAPGISVISPISLGEEVNKMAMDLLKAYTAIN